MTWLETIEEAKNEIIALREINADLLEACKYALSAFGEPFRYEVVGEDDRGYSLNNHGMARHKMREAIRKAEEQMR